MPKKRLHCIHHRDKRLLPPLVSRDSFLNNGVGFGGEQELANLVMHRGREIRHVDGGLALCRGRLHPCADSGAETYDLR